MAPPKSAQPTLYEILSLTPKHLEGQTSTAQSKVVKKAYHKALLQNHPDKVNAQKNNGSNSSSDDGTSTTTNTKTQSSKSTSKNESTTIFTVDQIQEAYTTLSDSKKRTAYNRSLATQSVSSSTTTSSSRTHNFSFTKSFQTGMEIVDLDDCDFDERKGLYFRACRCGNPRGYRFKERDLEENEDEGVLMVECLDCSLWLRVLFTAALDSGDEQEQRPQKQQQQKQNGQRQNSAASFSSSSSQPQNVQRVGSNQSVQRNNSGEKKGGWSFKLSLGLSLGGSASASASSGRQ